MGPAIFHCRRCGCVTDNPSWSDDTKVSERDGVPYIDYTHLPICPHCLAHGLELRPMSPYNLSPGER